LQFDSSRRWSFDAENARAAQDARGQFVRYLRAKAAPGGDISMAELVFGELIGNVVRHAPGSIEIDLDWSGEYPALHVIDRGRAFDGVSHLPDNVLSESGRGLFIVNALTRSLRIEHVPGYGNHVTAELPLRRKFE
jgi:anti-sigma regulatory factor (Ser/Thr protein kinase)